MRLGALVAVPTVLCIMFSATSALAVGYERHEVGSPSATDQRQAPAGTGLAESLRKASFLDKVPGYLDETASAVKAILGQFGLVDGRTR
jgi:hypothetical protein